jgi:transposase
VYSTDVLTNIQVEILAKHLPQPQAKTGRPAYTNLELLPGILKVLRAGCRWRDLDYKGYPSYATHWRRLRYWQIKGGFDDLFNYLLKMLNQEDKLELEVTAIDGTLIQSFAFKELTQYSGHYHKTGTKISLVVDNQGIPLSRLLTLGAANDWSLAKGTIEQINPTLLAGVKRMLADKGYSNTHMMAYLYSLGITPDIPEKALPVFWRQKLVFKNLDELRIRGPSNGHKRFVVERSNAWIKNFRRLRFRFDYSILSFSALLNLALVVLCVRKLVN